MNVDTYWELIGDDLTELVKGINASPLTTRNHYGRYLQIISDLKPQIGLKNAVRLLIKAGADRQGVTDASRIF